VIDGLFCTAASKQSRNNCHCKVLPENKGMLNLGNRVTFWDGLGCATVRVSGSCEGAEPSCIVCWGSSLAVAHCTVSVSAVCVPGEVESGAPLLVTEDSYQKGGSTDH